MKYTTLIILALMLCGCGSRNSRQSADAETETTQDVDIPIDPMIDSLLPLSQNNAATDSARIVAKRFIQLWTDGKDEDALDFYLDNKHDFFVAFERSTQTFEFHSEIVLPLLLEYKEPAVANPLAVEMLEMCLLQTEGVINLSDGKTIPSHYPQLLPLLGMMYIEVEQYENALALTDKMLGLFDNEKNIATVYYNKALCYVYLNDDKNALEYTMRAISIYDKLGMQDTEEFKNAEQLIGAIERIAEEKAN